MITLATLPEATSQEVFDQVAAHLLTQGKKSQNPSKTTCAYRGTKNRVCAAGNLMTDKEYKHLNEQIRTTPRGLTTIEGESWSGLVKLRLVPGAHEALIAALQSVHDGMAVSDWPASLAYTAHRFNLTFKI